MKELTRREIQIIELMMKGNSNKEIAALLHISESTVKNHASNLYHKLKARNRSQAIVRYLKLCGQRNLWNKLRKVFTANPDTEEDDEANLG